MHRSHSSFRRFSLRSLLFAGAVASLSLPLGREAYGIGGSAIQAAYTPRESVGAAPSISLINTGASASSSAAAASSGGGGGGSESSTAGSGSGGAGRSRSVSSEDEGSGTTAKRRRARRTSEEGGTSTRIAKGGTKAGAKAEPKDQKDYKSQPPMTMAEKAKPVITISTGYETRYLYHGLDIISFNSRPDADGDRSSAIAYANADFSYQGLHIGVGYINSVSKVIPFLQFTNNRIDTTQRYFQEVDINVDYTVQVVANILDATLGYNSYIFPNNQFKGTGYQGELLFRLAYKQLPFVTPSFTFYHGFSEFHNDRVGNLNGSLVEFRLDGAIPLVKKENFSVSIAPYVSAIYNIDFLNYTGNPDGNVGGWSVFETGVKLPISFAKHFTVTPYGNYGADITPDDSLPVNNHTNRGFGERTTFWGGITFTYAF